MTTINDTENTIDKLNIQIQNITTELQAIKMLVKEQFCLIKKSLTEIGNHSEPQQNKDENLVQENKSKTTTRTI